eukprot:836479_1
MQMVDSSWRGAGSSHCETIFLSTKISFLHKHEISKRSRLTLKKMRAWFREIIFDLVSGQNREAGPEDTSGERPRMTVGFRMKYSKPLRPTSLAKPKRRDWTETVMWAPDKHVLLTNDESSLLQLSYLSQ